MHHTSSSSQKHGDDGSPLSPREHVQETTDVDTSTNSETDSIIDLEDLTYIDDTELASHIRNFRFEHGRRYHGIENAPYPLPNDERESERLDLEHQLWLIHLDGKLHMAPLKPDITDALDIATGTGIWALDFADQYPHCQVIGTDLSPIQPRLGSVNATFKVEDSDKSDWSFDHQFDFIHARMCTFGWTNWPRFFQQAFKFLKPGGWFELQEFSFPFECADDTCSSEDPCIKWSKYVVEAEGKRGINMTAYQNWENQLKEAGFVDLHRKLGRWPINQWTKTKKGKIMGMLGQRDIQNGIDGMATTLMTHVLGWSSNEVDEYIAEAKEQLADMRRHIYMPVYVYWGKKPEEAGQAKTTT